MIRTELFPEETFLPEIEYEKIFLSECHGIYLTKRGDPNSPNFTDNHILFGFLVEDDENWFKLTDTSSSAWLPDMIELLTFVNKWLVENAEKDGRGWKFKNV